MDDANRWCEGCLRSLGEIAGWGSMADREKLALWTQLTERRKELSAPQKAPLPDA